MSLASEFWYKLWVVSRVYKYQGGVGLRRSVNLHAGAFACVVAWKIATEVSKRFYFVGYNHSAK